MSELVELRVFGNEPFIFRVGDKVRFMSLQGEVVKWTSQNKLLSWMVPVVFDDDNPGNLITLVHCGALDKIWPAAPLEAKIGDPEFSGVWQPTGEKFEVMFRLEDPAGSFHLRERQ